MMRFCLPGRWIGWLALAPLSAGLAGCGQQFGALLYHMGVGGNQKVEAQFELPKAPTLVLVDDNQNLVNPRTACDATVESLATELQQRGLVDRVTTNEELAKLRLSHPDFDRRGAREVGRLAHADTVVWVEIKRFALPEKLDRVMAEVPFAATVKVLNAQSETRDEVRLWPKEREGAYVEVKVSPHDLQRCKDLAEAHRSMAAELAKKIAELFYTHAKEEP